MADGKTQMIDGQLTLRQLIELGERCLSFGCSEKLVEEMFRESLNEKNSKDQVTNKPKEVK